MASMRIVLRNVLSCAVALSLGLAAIGCGQPEVRAPNPTRSLDERRAVEIIRRAVADEGVRPAPARDVDYREGKMLRIDVGVEGHDYGIAYISLEDAEKLGDTIPRRNNTNERLHIARAGQDGETRVVLLYQDNYFYDDLAGESHEQTTITAESALSRDVRDFITHAKAKKLK
jgi:hypothetical protein